MSAAVEQDPDMDEKEVLVVNPLNSNVVTEEMIAEEKRLEEKAILEEEKKKSKMLEEKKKNEEMCYKRLHLLLSRSSIYAQYMAEKLQTYEAKQEKNQERKRKQEARGETDIAKSESPVKKRRKAEVNIMEVYKKENMGDFKSENGLNAGNSLKTSKSNDLSSRQPSLFYGGSMRDYQIEGYEWLKTLFEYGVNGILADEMGLGKTIQTIAFIAHLIEMGVTGPFFVCGPLSTVSNWHAEFKRFAPDIPILLYHGSKDERKEIRKKVNKKHKVKNFYSYPVVITSYQITLFDTNHFKNIEWKMLVIDEAHRIKNFQCKLVTELKRYNAVQRLLLTGTPLQNNLAELWSLLNFILPEIFDDLQVFQSWFDISRLSQNNEIAKEIIAQEQEKKIISTIHQILTPFLLRRTKAEVELELPSKKEVIVNAPLTALQHKYYTCVLNKTIRKYFNKEPEHMNIENLPQKRKRKATSYFGTVAEEVDLDELLGKAYKNETEEESSHNDKDIAEAPLQDKEKTPDSQIDQNIDVLPHQNGEEEIPDGFSEVNIQLANTTMILRKICLHPYLISYPIAAETADYKVDEDIIKASGKLLVMDQLLPELKKRGHKILLFSQFVSMLHILEDYCYFRNYKYSKLYGTMNLVERDENIAQFRDDPSTLIFLISTKAGGLGLNLISADTVIIYDSDWNPQGDLQAQDRCHRIGQKKPVVVYRLMVPRTVDQKIMEYATAKRKLEKVIMQKGRFASKDSLIKPQKAITEEELLELLESSDASKFVDADNFALSPEEMEKILDRSDLIAE